MPSEAIYPGNNLMTQHENAVNTIQAKITKYSNFLRYFNLAFKAYLGPVPQVKSSIINATLLESGGDEVSFTLRISLENNSILYKYELLCKASPQDGAENIYKIKCGDLEPTDYQVDNCIGSDDNLGLYRNICEQIKSKFSERSPIMFEVSNFEFN